MAVESWPRRLVRMFKHRWWDEADVSRLLPTAAMDRLHSRVEASERGHSGEIRVCVEPGLPLSYLWRGSSARERAVALFGELRVWDTEGNNGVLIYLLLAEHAIELVVDRALARAVPPEAWQAIVARLGESLRARRFEEGLMQAIDEVDGLLRLHFAADGDDVNANELPDRPHVP